MYELKEELNIENMIYEIRGKQVMLDSDLAKLYECKNGTKDINKAVEYYQEAAKLNNKLAQENLGMCYASGSGVEKDKELALYWLKKAKEK